MKATITLSSKVYLAVKNFLNSIEAFNKSINLVLA